MRACTSRGHGTEVPSNSLSDDVVDPVQYLGRTRNHKGNREVWRGFSVPPRATTLGEGRSCQLKALLRPTIQPKPKSFVKMACNLAITSCLVCLTVPVTHEDISKRSHLPVPLRRVVARGSTFHSYGPARDAGGRGHHVGASRSTSGTEKENNLNFLHLDETQKKRAHDQL